MSPHRTRVRSLYVLIFLNLTALFCTVLLALYVNHLRAQVDRAEQRSYAGCLRGNVLREVARYAMTELGSPKRAELPELQTLDCARLYPGGKP